MGLSVPCFFPFVCSVIWLSLFHVAVAYFASSLQPLCHDDERTALLQFKDSLIIRDFDVINCDPSTYRKVAMWNLEENSDCCSWDGIKCNAETGHVIRLDVSNSCLYGSIDSTSILFHLVHLEWLSLAYNDFSDSEIPAAIKNLSKLSHLNLSSSAFRGQIPPELLELPNLESLDLSGNSYNRIPDDAILTLELRVPSLQNLVEKLTNLKVINLDSVYISSPIPRILANLSSLTYLSLRQCELRGEFPIQIFQLPNLSVLKVGGNRNLTGYIPEFARSSPLTFLDIGSCNFSGTIPSSLGNLTKLVHLDISFNNFLGELPISIGELSSLKELLLQGYTFPSQISSSWVNFTQLTYLDFSFGQISSPISWIAKSTKLTFLILRNLNLVGEIPCWLMNLTQLTHLDMSLNQLTGPIPSCLMNMNLTQLIHLDMSLNQLTGPIPSCLMNMNRLSFLYLQSNHLTGHIPSEIRNLTQLIKLDLSSNSFQGPLPSTFFELKNLRYLDLHSNNLSGIVELDIYLSQLESLRTLSLSSNSISVLTDSIVRNTKFPKLRSLGLQSCNLSVFPKFLHDQDSLLSLDLSSNKIPGLIPRWFLNVTMPNCEYLNLSHNLFTGFDQNSIIFLRVCYLDLSFNKLQGLLPIPIDPVVVYLASNNKLTGEISSLICKSKLLYALDLSNNNLSGKLPQCLANFSNALSLLALQNNKFHGSIPQTFMNGTNLRMIDVSNNLLQGRIPRSLANCAKLKYLHLGNNQITDVFPSWLGTLEELEILILKSNRLHGAITEPEKDFEFPKLRVIDVSHNMFRGELPTKYLQSWNAMKVVNESHLTYLHDKKEFIGTYTFYRNFDYAYSMIISNKGIDLNYEKISNMLNSITLSENKFVGEIPACIASLRGLHNLNLSHNNLEGHIPSSLGNLTALESLDLSSNKLSGKIPQQLVEITSLEVFNVSYNHLIGPIPQGKQFSTFGNSSFDGNPELCGKPLSKNCENSEPLKKEDEDSEASSVFDWKIILIGFASGLIVGVVLGNEFYTRIHEQFLKVFGMPRMKRWSCQN